MNLGSSTLHRLSSVLLAVLVVTSAGCIGFGNSSQLDAGELHIFNQDSETHYLVIRGLDDSGINQSVAANSSETVTLVESRGEYNITVTIDGVTRVNTTVRYSPGGKNGEQLAGPKLLLTIQSDGDAYFSQSMV